MQTQAGVEFENVVCSLFSAGTWLSLEFGFLFAVILSVTGAPKNPN